PNWFFATTTATMLLSTLLLETQLTTVFSKARESNFTRASLKFFLSQATSSTLRPRCSLTILWKLEKSNELQITGFKLPTMLASATQIMRQWHTAPRHWPRFHIFRAVPSAQRWNLKFESFLRMAYV